MKIRLSIDGTIGFAGGSLRIAETLALLDAIAATRSLQGAATRVDRSYRAIWGKVAAIEAALGQPVVVKTKGHGTVLAPAGEALCKTLRGTIDRFEAELARETDALSRQLLQRVGAAAAPLRLAASHDPLLLEMIADDASVALAICGSEEALARLRTGTADAAGCHFGMPGASPPQTVRRALETGGLTALALFRREQGLITAPGNPLRLRGVGDIARRGARFVNRQRGSGTRAWFDRLLAEAKVAPARIRGYASEEFTHQAVAAVIAAGQGDVGLGARAAAARFGLGFQPLGEETYFLVLAKSRAREPHIVTLVERLRAASRGRIGYRR